MNETEKTELLENVACLTAGMEIVETEIKDICKLLHKIALKMEAIEHDDDY